ASVGAEQGGEDPNRRGLAGAVRAEHAQDGPRLGLDVDAVEGPDVVEGLGQLLGHDGGTAVPARGVTIRIDLDGHARTPGSAKSGSLAGQCERLEEAAGAASLELRGPPCGGP